MLDPDAALDYVTFVEARHEAWWARQQGKPAPWTDEPIVATRKFTNVFRAIDFGSQFLITELLDPELPAREILMRCFLYRHTNRPEPWEYFELLNGRMPLVEDLDEHLLTTWHEYRGRAPYETEGGARIKGERQIFSGAYLVFPQSQIKGTDKAESIVALTRRLFHPDSPDDVVPDFMAAITQAERFTALQRNKGVGNFMSMQTLTDWGYSSQCGEDREDEFVVGGPGAIKGAAALNPGARTGDVILWARDAVHASPGCPELPLDNPLGMPRLPSLMDIQNTLCEFSKYVRFQSKPPVQKPYRPAHPGLQLPPVLPAHW